MPTLAPGALLDRYELVREIAQGGMGAVWRARLRGKHGFERPVAIKVLLPQFANDDRFRKMLLDEARIASAIDHPNVVRILDLGESEGVLYLVMDWVEGRTLESLAVHRALPIGVSMRIVADVCAGLHAAHELRDDGGALRRVVHRDVSPDNVLVNGGGVARLTDFGIARARDRMSDETSLGRVKGKLGYIAPEQALRKRIDRRVDVWATGATLYRLIAGRPPFGTLDELADFINGNCEVPRFPPGVPLDVEDCVRRALDRDPRARYPTAGEMQRALEAASRVCGLALSHEEVARFVAEPPMLDGEVAPESLAATEPSGPSLPTTRVDRHRPR
jgi:eukaryotic-like serine/threonine-protein kinase